MPVEHWFRLGRTLTHASGETALVSWSGSMFEYLMPALVMRSFPFTLLDQTYQGAVRRHIAYGAEHGVPWGMSESAYNLRDRHLTYQYRAFGVPDLALKRGLGRDLVIAPYASALAVLVDPPRALANLDALEERGALGPYGFRDALDYTRPQPGQHYAVVGAYMAHHMGMGLVALANALHGQTWQRRFHTDPIVRSAELLLHERMPRRLVLQEPQSARADEALPDPEIERPSVRQIDTADTPQPRVALLGHLPYTVMVTNCGGGYSRYEELAVTRWRADGTRDNTGQFCYVKDVTTGKVWSSAHQPVCAAGRTLPRPARHRSRHLRPRRRRHRDSNRDRRGPRRCRRSPPGDGGQHGRRDARGRAHELRRDRARAARRRASAPGLRQSLRRDRMARVVYRRHGHAAPALSRASSRAGWCTSWPPARNGSGR